VPGLTVKEESVQSLIQEVEELKWMLDMGKYFTAKGDISRFSLSGAGAGGSIGRRFEEDLRHTGGSGYDSSCFAASCFVVSRSMQRLLFP
jgi:hypothetical protein